MYLPNNTYLLGGKYRIIRHIASGGFGNTYEAMDNIQGIRVAIKEFFPKVFCNRDENSLHVSVSTQYNGKLVEKLRKKFNEEANAVFAMKHKNIVRIIDIFEENGTAYYAMEYVDGKSLHDLSQERGALPEAEAVGYIRQICDALDYVHKQNRLHLDIKPGNIMVDKNGRAVLIDFGTSKQYDEEAGENTTTLMGKTPGYAPLEQMGNDVTKFTPATDIYSLAASLYKALSGKTPPSSLLLAGGEKLPPLPSSVSAQVISAIRAAMQTNKANRPQSVAAFVSSLSTLVVSDDNEAEDADTDAEETTVLDLSPKQNPAKKINQAPLSQMSSGAEEIEETIVSHSPQPQPKAEPQLESKQKQDQVPESDISEYIEKREKNNRMIFLILAAVVALVILIAFCINNNSKSSESSYSYNPVAPASVVEEVEQEVAEAVPEASQTVYLSGSIGEDMDGKYPVQMEIYVYANGYIEGNYFYESEGPYNRLAIIGNKSGKSIRLDEYNDKGQCTGTFNGTYSGGVYSGTFTNYKGKKFNFKLTSY